MAGPGWFGQQILQRIANLYDTLKHYQRARYCGFVSHYAEIGNLPAHAGDLRMCRCLDM